MYIAFVGLSGVPYSKRAADTRLLAFANMFNRLGHSVFIFNRIYDPQNLTSNNYYKEKEKVEIIEIFNKGKKIYRSLPLWILNMFSYFKEAYKIIKTNRRYNISLIHVYSGHFIDFLFYFLLSKITKSKVVYQYVEFRSAIERKGLYHKLNGILCDNIGVYLFDGIICISNYIQKHVNLKSKKVDTIKVPPICDFEYFDSISVSNIREKYILYCGSTDYIEIIDSIINSYNNSLCGDYSINLHLVINGRSEDILALKTKNANNNNIVFKSNLSYDTLVNSYKNALALIIPLRNTTQDIARFPNKICEYTASKNLIITTGNGEIPFYFEDKLNALICSKFTENCFSEKINWMILNEKEVSEMRKNAYMLGKRYFNIDSYIDEMYEFLRELFLINK